MLSACKAIAIGRSAAQIRTIVRLATIAGFGIIETPEKGDAPAPHALICFVLVHEQVGDALLRHVISAIRGGAQEVRFSPIVVLGNDCPFEQVLHFVHLGVDDVISLPEKREVLIQRLCQQLWTEQAYFETNDYFGPDRRRYEAADDGLRTGLVAHTRYDIQRLPDVGTRIVRHQIHSRRVGPPPPPVGSQRGVGLAFARL